MTGYLKLDGLIFSVGEVLSGSCGNPSVPVATETYPDVTVDPAPYGVH